MIDPFLIINVIILILLVLSIYRKVKYRPLGKYYLPGLALKFIAGIAFGLLHIIIYEGGDTMLYHEDATRLALSVFDNPLDYIAIIIYNDSTAEIWPSLHFTSQPRAFFLAKILSFIHILTNSNYWISGFYFSLFAYSGLFTLADRLTTYFPWTRNGAIIAFLFFPSVVVWSAGISKEAVSTGLITWIMAIYVPALGRGDSVPKRRILISIVFFIVLWVLKYYYAAVLVAALFPTLLVAVLKSISAGISWSFHKQFLYWASFSVWAIVIASFLHPNLRLTEIMKVIHHNYELFAEMSDPDGMIQFKNLEPTFRSFASNLHLALFGGLYRPLPADASGFPGIVTAYENIFILVFSVLALLNIGRINKSNNGILVVGATTYIMISAIFLAFSAPNFGTLTRYKSGFLAILVYLILADPIFKRLFKKY